MRIEEIMRRRVVTVTPSTTIKEALSLLRGNRIRHLPVVENDKLVGIVSDRDMRDALPSNLCEHDDDELVLQKPIEEIMHRNVITAHPLDFVEDAASTVYDFKVGSLPVVEADRVVGIITESDILNCLVELFGVNKPSSHIELEVDDRAGMLADVSQVFKDANVNVNSVIVYPGDNPGKKKIVFRVTTIDPRHVIELLHEKGFIVNHPIKGGIRP
ncbi:CBS and ACT domain-containing protein [Brevibacillus sp. SYSU BS000544]|uniref:CBS and ACT domain-containing protein n=1 Tax=Brevibacillus sp. SYSU BS000544 TaxID=3416443 RepID=UPI003CE47E9B